MSVCSSMAIVCVNVGGGVFVTSASTLNNSPFFDALLRNSSDSHEVFVDRDPSHFRHILNWLRGVRWLPDDDSILRELSWEADYYCMSDMHEFIRRKKDRYPSLNRSMNDIRGDLQQRK